MAKLRVDKIATSIVKDEFTGSVFFDGNGDHLDVPLSDDFQFGAGEFTIEAWVYLLTAKDAGIFGTNKSSGSFAGYELDVFTNGSVRFYSGNGSAYNYSSLGAESAGGFVPLRTWTHVAVSRQGNTLRLFANGILITENKSFSHTIATSPSSPDIGSDGISTGSTYHTHGYISNLRVCKGHAVYTGNFTVPTRELEVHTKAPKGVVFPAADNRTVLLACQSSTDATAEATGRHILTTAGNAHAQSANPGLLSRSVTTSGITTTTTDSVWFDGTGDYLATEVNSDFALGSDDFTFEMWVYYENRGTGDTPACWDEVTTTFAPLIGYIENAVGLNGHAVVYISNTGGGWNIASGKTFGLITAKQWYHLAITRSGTDFYLFKDGYLTDSFTSGLPIYQSANKLGFGRIQNIDRFDGYVSNARLIKGKALYTSEFTPPTRELEVTPETVFLGLYDGENIFAEKTGKIIAAYGDRSSGIHTVTESPIGITTNSPGLVRDVEPTDGPTFQGGAGFVSQSWLTLPKGTTTERFPDFNTNAVTTGGTRGIYHGAEFPTTSTFDTIEYLNIATLGNGQDFGDLINQKANQIAYSSSTRGLFASGYTPSPASGNDFIDYVTIMSTGNSKDFGDLSFVTYVPDACANETRGICAGGAAAPNYGGLDNIDYVTISTLGNGKDFGNLTDARHSLTAISSPTRGIFGLGQTNVNTMDYITIASTGDAKDFGDLMLGRAGAMGASTSTRGLFAGGYTGSPAVRNIIEFITMSTMGSSQDFGDLTAVRRFGGGTSSLTRGVFIAGYNPSATNIIDYVNIQTTGNAVDFGDSSLDTQSSACSNGHGGL